MSLEVQQINMSLYQLKEADMWHDPVMMDLDMYLKQHEAIDYLINYTEDQMRELRKDAHIRAKNLVHPEFVADFLDVLSHAYWDEVESAQRIAKQLGLNRKHFMAIDGNESEMQKTLKEESDDDRFYD